MNVEIIGLLLQEMEGFDATLECAHVVKAK